MENVGYFTMGDLQDGCLKALSLLRNEVIHVFDAGRDEDKLVTATLKSLFSYLSSRQQAVLYLWSGKCTWDAEIVLRAYYETAAKIIYISFVQADRKSQTVNEFAVELGAIGDRRLGIRATHYGKISEPGSVSAEIIAALRDEDQIRTDIEGNKAYRKKLEQKWSFTELMGILDRGDGCRPLIGAKALLHGYGIASHLIHADQIALDLMRDRCERSEEERRLLEMSQSTRIMSDLVNIGFLCAGALRLHYDVKFAHEPRLLEAIGAFNAIARPFQKAFEDSQASRYEDVCGADRDACPEEEETV